MSYLPSPSKELGQHFLIDDNIVRVIGRLADIRVEDVVLEIGPGQGVLTEYLAEHAGLVSVLKQFTWQDVILVGGDFANVPHPFRFFHTSVEAASWLKANPVKQALILVKGSRSMQMEKVMESI